MANSKFAYVKLYEEEKKILPNCYFVLRVDGCEFKKFVKEHKYEKPNDIKGINLMNECAIEILKKFDEIDLCYGHSDEYSFLFRKSCNLWNRRCDKILTSVVSSFTSFFIFKWKQFFQSELLFPPTFDGRIILYPGKKEIKDYFSWRQVDCHINTLYNECFWNLVLKGNLSKKEAHKYLMTTLSKDKNELLFSKFNINYNNLPEVFRRGTIIIRNKRFKKNEMKQEQDKINEKETDEKNTQQREQINHTDETKEINENNNFKRYIVSHENLVSEQFWLKYDYILKDKIT